MTRMERVLANFQGEEDDVEAVLYELCVLFVIHFRAATINRLVCRQKLYWLIREASDEKMLFNVALQFKYVVHGSLQKK